VPYFSQGLSFTLPKKKGIAIQKTHTHMYIKHDFFSSWGGGGGDVGIVAMIQSFTDVFCYKNYMKFRNYLTASRHNQ